MKSAIFLTAGLCVAQPVNSGPKVKRDVQDLAEEVISMLPAQMDTRYYTVSGTTTRFIGSHKDSAALTTATVTAVDGGTTTTAPAEMAIYSSTTQDGSTEVDVVLAPALRDRVAHTIFNVVRNERVSHDTSQEDGAILSPLGIDLGKELSPSVLVSLAGATAKSAIWPVTLLFRTEVLVDGVTYHGPTALAMVAYAFQKLGEAWPCHDQAEELPAAIKLEPHLFKPKDQCPQPMSVRCSDDYCSGNDLNICTTTHVFGCPCKNHCPSSEDGPLLCDTCGGLETWKCTTGQHEGCGCLPLGHDSVEDPVDGKRLQNPIGSEENVIENADTPDRTCAFGYDNDYLQECTHSFDSCKKMIKKGPVGDHSHSKAELSTGTSRLEDGDRSKNCGDDCCGLSTDVDWCILNCKVFYGNPCGQCQCNGWTEYMSRFSPSEADTIVEALLRS